MGTKIDYVATLKPLQVILNSKEISAENKNKIILEIIDNILNEAEQLPKE
ncbi:MAG: hypothetical protein FWF08_02450 [Oscillospiraceae bacterium]|nr:hypothetical protein [Oscillospiraceae bacterium]